LTQSANPRRYWSDLKGKLIESEGFSQLYDFIVQLKLVANDGKMRETETADTETMFRIIQSIPSPKVEPFFKYSQPLCQVSQCFENRGLPQLYEQLHLREMDTRVSRMQGTIYGKDVHKKIND